MGTWKIRKIYSDKGGGDERKIMKFVQRYEVS